MQPGIVQLLVGGYLYEGWVSVEVSRSIKEMAGTFTLGVTEPWAGGVFGQSSLRGWRIRKGDPCVVLYAGLPVITGHVDARNPKYTKDKHDITIQGRSKTGDLCDCSAEADVENGEMNVVTLDQIARKVAKAYGIGVVVKADTSEVFDTVRVHNAETAQEFIERYARPGAVNLTDDENGNLVLMQVKDGGAVATLIEGVNILEASAVDREDNRYSDYEVKGQDRGSNGEFGKPVAQRRAAVKDGAVKRHRPFRMLNETKTSKKNAKSRAEASQAARAGESIRCEIKVADWRTPSGKLWMPGDLVFVQSPMLLDAARTLAVESCKHTQDESGTITMLSLVPPEALNPQAGAKGGGDDSWSATKPTEDPVLYP
jgi:prophage tail gpP-like protein